MFVYRLSAEEKVVNNGKRPELSKLSTVQFGVSQYPTVISVFHPYIILNIAAITANINSSINNIVYNLFILSASWLNDLNGL